MRRKLLYTDNPTGLGGNVLPTHALRVSYQPTQPTQNPFSSGAIGPLTATQGSRMAVSVVRVTEDYHREFPDVASLFKFLAPDPIELPIGDPRFINYIIREGSMIAARTRRGAGNYFLHAYDTKVPEAILNQLRGTNCTPVASPGLGPDQAFIMYRQRTGVKISDGVVSIWNDGILDAPYTAVVHRDRVEAVVLPSSSEVLGKAQDFCASFIITG